MSQPVDKHPSERIAFVGVGRMGAAMLQSVLDAGYHASLYDPFAEATAPFAASHPQLVRVAASARQAAQGADIIEVAVNTNEQLLAACLGPDGVFAGAARGRSGVRAAARFQRADDHRLVCAQHVLRIFR